MGSSFFETPTDYEVVQEGGEGSSFYDGPAYTEIDPVALEGFATAAAASATAAAASAAAAAASAGGVPGDATPLMDGAAAAGVADPWAREDHVHPTDTSRADAAATTAALALKAATTYVDTQDAALTSALALKAPLASPTFTGTPAAPTPSAGDNSTKIATTAYVDTADALKAPLASPTFTGTPAAPTAAVGTNTTQLATTAFVKAAFGATLAASGYQKLPSGLIFQWGLYSGGDGSAAFPIAFPAACLGVTATHQYAAGTNVLVSESIASVTTTGFNIYPRYTGGGAPDVSAETVRWMAWGY